MTDSEKQAIETMKHWIDYEKTNKDKINKADELIEIQETVLNLIEKQQAEIEVYKDIKELAGTEIKEILNWKYENKKLKSEIENLQKALATYTAHTVCSDIKQSYKHNEDLEMLYKGCQIELEEKEARIKDLEQKLNAK